MSSIPSFQHSGEVASVGQRVLQPWVEDVVEQLALADILHRSGSASVRRLALIIVDNAVEIAFKTYVEFDKGLDYFNLKWRKWEEDYKPSFKSTLQLVSAKSGAKIDEKLVLGYHDTRNQLYHDPKLLSVEADDVGRYLHEARSLVDQLFALNFSSADWTTSAGTVAGEVFPKVVPPKIAVIRKEDGTLKIEGILGLRDTHAVSVIIQKLLDTTGKVPSFRELRATLKSSGKSPSNLSDCILRLRKRGILKKRELSLTPAGQAELAEFLS